MGRIILFIVVLLLGACASMTVSKRRGEFIKAHPDLTAEQRIAIYRGGVIVDMTEEMVLAAWGEPDSRIEKNWWGKKATAWIYQRQSGDCLNIYEIDFVEGRVVEARLADANFLLYPPFKNCYYH